MSKCSKRCSAVIVFATMLVGIALVAAPRTPEEIQADLDTLVLEISGIRERLSALEKEILKNDDIDSLKLEQENLGQERALSEAVDGLLACRH